MNIIFYWIIFFFNYEMKICLISLNLILSNIRVRFGCEWQKPPNTSSLNTKGVFFLTYESRVGNSGIVWQLCSRKSSMSQALPASSQGGLSSWSKMALLQQSPLLEVEHCRAKGWPAGCQEKLLKSGALDFTCYFIWDFYIYVHRFYKLITCLYHTNFDFCMEKLYEFDIIHSWKVLALLIWKTSYLGSIIVKRLKYFF